MADVSLGTPRDLVAGPMDPLDSRVPTGPTWQPMRPPQRPWWRALARTALTGAIVTGATALSFGTASRADVLPPAPGQQSSATGTVAAPWPVIAHRGGTLWGPEHTRATFEHALTRGVDGIELDVRFTRDAVPVVMHDHTVDRTTECTGLVTALTAAHLAGCDAGTWFGDQFAGERAQTLDGALTTIARSPTITVVLHVKTCRRGEGAAIVQALRRSGLTERATMLSRSPVCLERLAAAGAPRLAYAVNSPTELRRGVSAGYPVLVTYQLTLDAATLVLARSRGAQVFAVAGYPHTLAELALLPVDAVIADDAEAAMRTAGR
ncbi:MAG: glycerophosphodiester phosphodiesterase [Sporichthyaceae bacterium]